MTLPPAVQAGLSRVPQISVLFWVIKGLSTAMGESTSDFLVSFLGPIPAVLLGFVCFVAALVIQFTRRRYVPWSYWLTVVMVGVFGTMAADVLHVGFDVPYAVSTALYAVILAAVFIIWYRVEGTLSIHDITTARREVFYWLAVVSTFAMGTALGDFSATVLHLGYGGSVIAFALVILVPTVLFRVHAMNGVFAFWFAYVVTRPLGASVADGLAKPSSTSGLGFGDGPVAVVLTILIAIGVAMLYLGPATSRRSPGR